MIFRPRNTTMKVTNQLFLKFRRYQNKCCRTKRPHNKINTLGNLGGVKKGVKWREKQ